MFSSNCYRQWHSSFHNSPQSTEIFVPQNPYKPYGRDFMAKHPPIQFMSDFMEGMLLRDALEGKYQGLWGRDDSMFVGFGSSISLRIQVRTFANTFQACPHLFLCLKIKGYELCRHRIYTMDWCSPPKPITLAKLSTGIARCLEKFIKECGLFPDNGMGLMSILFLGQSRHRSQF
jgi:hypothetical protein